MSLHEWPRDINKELAGICRMVFRKKCKSSSAINGRMGRGLASLALLLLFGLACSPEKPAEQNEPEFEDPRAANLIWEDVRTVYQRAESYTDQGRIYLRYTLDGQRYEEPQPWETQWQRDRALVAHYFNARIRWDGRFMDAFVYDIETANLDGQQWVTSAPDESSMRALLDDPIAGPFVKGFREIPLDESNEYVQQEMVPPMLGWLTGAVDSFLDQVHRVDRQSDDILDGTRCTVLDCSTDGGTFRVWLSPVDHRLLQLRFPPSWLAPEVSQSPDISDVQLVARFHDASFQAALDKRAFQVQRRGDANLVRRWIPIPEPLPIERLGKKLRDASLEQISGEPLEPEDWAGRTVVVLWFDGDRELLETLEQIRREIDDPQVVFLAVADEELFRQLPDGTRAWPPEWATWIEDHEIRLDFAVDSNLAWVKRLGAKAMPLAIVIDGEGVMQYARAVGDEAWRVDLVAALRRVIRGDALASEMLTDYGRYLEDYERQLAMVDAAPLLDPNASRSGTSLQFEVDDVWRCRDLSQAGFVTSNGDRTFVIDGLVTIVELDRQGHEVRRRAVQMQTSEAITRVAMDWGGGGRMFAAWGLLGRHVAFGTWQADAVVEWPADSQSHDGITDVEWFSADPPRSDASPSELAVAMLSDEGWVQEAVDPARGYEPRVLVRGEVTSATLGGGGFYIQNGSLYSLATKRPVDTGGQFRYVAGARNLVVALNLDSLGRWHLFGVRPDGEVAWRVPVAEPLFQESLDFLVPAVGAAAGAEGDATRDLFGYLDKDHRLTLVDGAGDLVGIREMDPSLASFSLVRQSDTILLYASDANGVVCQRVVRPER